MSRIGRAIIPIPSGVDIKVEDGSLRVKGPKGEIVSLVPEGIEPKVDKGELTFSRTSDHPRLRGFHGLARALAANAVQGVTDGFTRELEIVGIGYRGAINGKVATFNLGFSHPIELPFPDGVKIEIQDNTKITVSGIDKQKVGQAAAVIRGLRSPDPYKGKGVRYKGEQLRLKVGKSGAAGG